MNPSQDAGWREFARSAFGRRWALPIFLLVFVSSRAAFLLAGLDPSEDSVANVLGEFAEEWDRGPERSLYDREELFFGAGAEAILNGLGLPLVKYRYFAFGGANKLVSVLGRQGLQKSIWVGQANIFRSKPHQAPGNI